MCPVPIGGTESTVLLNLHWSLNLSKLDYECIVLSNVGCGADKTCFHELPLISESMAMHSLKLHYFMLLCNGGIKNGFNIYFLKEHFIFYWWLFWIFKWRWQKYLQSYELYNIDDCTQRTLSYVINFRDDLI